MFKKRFLFWSVLLLGIASVALQAQTFPSGVVTSFVGPRTLFLDDYADPFKPRIRATIFFTDFSQTSWTFKLRLKITGPNGIVIQTKANEQPPNAINVVPGQPMLLEGVDLAWYFDFNHLDFTGINRAQFELSKRLPEGAYTFCFEALDYETGKALSHPACAAAYLALNDPALIVTPVCASVVENTSIQNILFQWQVSNITGNLDFSQLNYKIQLYEVNNNWSNPQNAIINNQAVLIWTSPALNQNYFLYSLTEPPLTRGKRYVFTVSTTHTGGRDSFKNNGVSAPCYFHFGYHENDTLEVITPLDEFQFAISSASQFKWKKPEHALPNQLITYTLRLVEVGATQTPEAAMLNNTPFYQQSYLPVNYSVIDKTIPIALWTNIKRMGHYAWQVKAQSGSQEVARSPVLQFTGPPAIEQFIASGFLMTITKLTAFDTASKIVSGRCKTVLNPSWGAATEFNFNSIGLTSIGSNQWVMSSGSIADAIAPADFTLQPKTENENRQAWFGADSIYVTTSAVNLSGQVRWNLPHPTTAGIVQQITSARSRLALANVSYYLLSTDDIQLEQAYQFNLLEPFGCVLKLNRGSTLSIYESKYDFKFKGFFQTSEHALTLAKTPANIAFEESAQLFYLTEQNNENSEAIRLAAGSNIDVQPLTYTIDLSERKSPTEFGSDSLWKGVYIGLAKLQIPKTVEESAQLKLPLAKSYSITNTANDTLQAHITGKGLTLKQKINFPNADTLKFNTFPSKSAYLYARILNSEIEDAGIRGSIVIPLLDTLQTFPYKIELTEQGFQEGYLLQGLAGHQFTFNPTGASEQRIPISIQRAVFKGRNSLDLDLNLQWPHFDLSINGVQGLSVWGNGNIGFDVPNGKSSLTNQCKGKASNFDITVDYLGCGRNGNAYAFGASAKMNMDEEISGETGPPVINAYSICRNPLLTGTVTTSAPTPSTSSSTGSSSTSAYVSGTASYTQALQGGLSDVMTTLGVGPKDSLSDAGLFNPDESKIEPLIKGATVMQIKELVDLIYRLKPYIKTKSITDRDWMVLDRFSAALQSDIVSQAQMTNGKGLINFVLNKAVESIVLQLNGTIQSLSDKGMYIVRGAVKENITKPIDKKIEDAIGSVFDRLKTRVLSQVDQENHTLVNEVFAAVKKELVKGINNSVNESFETNITSKLGDVVQLGVTAKVKSFVQIEITDAANKLIKDGAKADIRLDQFLKNSSTLLSGIADTVKDVIMSINGRTFINTAESLVEDAVMGINWEGIATNIFNQLVVKGLSNAIANQVSALVGQNAGPYVSAALSTVKFDFTNLGDKLKNGQFDKIVKFDPTNIYISTPAIDVRGALAFKKDDAVFGDNWQADVMVRVKVPKKDNPVECSAFFLNGKTTGTTTSSFTYWFARLAVTGFSVPLTPAPVIWDGVEGFAFSKMRKTGLTTIVPDDANKFGVGAKFYFYDQQSSGKSYVFDLGAEATFNDGGTAIQLVGNASVFNTQKQNGKYKPPGFITGAGTLGYYKTPELSKIAGNFDVEFHTSPVLCAGGNVGLDLRTPSDWKVWVGTQQAPINVKLLCKDFLSNTAYFEASQSGFRTGLAMNVNVLARTGWIETSTMKFRGFTQMQLGYSASTSLQWDPTFKINDASLSAWVMTNIGIDYQVGTTTSSLVLAGVALSGALTYQSQPEAELHGEMAGSITLLNYNLQFTAPVNYSLSKQKILD